MEVLSRVFAQNPAALRLHRELTVCLAHGDAARAADLAAVLADCVRRLTQDAPPSDTASSDGLLTSTQQASPESAESTDAALEPPRADAQDVDHAMCAMQRALESSTDAASTAQKWSAMPFWRSPQSLCVTLLESAFETDVPSGEAAGQLSAAGDAALKAEREQLRVLDLYLHREDARWRAQKSTIVKVVLDTARGLGLTPEDVHAAEGGGTAMGSDALNVLRHCNLVIRGEVPEAVAPGMCVEDELAVLKARMAAVNHPLSPQDEELARCELRLSHSTMRYLVGVHRELQLALDASPALQKGAAAAGAPVVSGSQFFVNEVMRALHSTAHLSLDATPTPSPDVRADALSVETARVVATPVLPFTFMLKCCLWFDVPAASS